MVSNAELTSDRILAFGLRSNVAKEFMHDDLAIAKQRVKGDT